MKKSPWMLLIFPVLLGGPAACGGAGLTAKPDAKMDAKTAASDLKSDDEKTLYALGLVISDNLAAFGLSPAELEVVKSGITDGALKKEPKVKVEEWGPKIRPLAEARESKVGQAFLDKAAAEAGAKKTASGLVFKDIKAGTGEAPKASDQVKVHYKGTLTDGSVFDSSIDRGEPATFPLGGVIPCWTEGLQLMKVGGKSQLVCPASLAYGDKGAGGKIRPGATLVFEVELLEILPAAAAPAAAPAASPAGH